MNGRFPQDEALLRFVVKKRAKGLPITCQIFQFKTLEIHANTFKAA